MRGPPSLRYGLSLQAGHGSACFAIPIGPRQDFTQQSDRDELHAAHEKNHGQLHQRSVFSPGRQVLMETFRIQKSGNAKAKSRARHAEQSTELECGTPS